MFPGIDTRFDVAAAIWFATDFQHHVEIPAGLTHPRNIREWAMENAPATADPFTSPEDHSVLSKDDAQWLKDHRLGDRLFGPGPSNEVIKLSHLFHPWP